MTLPTNIKQDNFINLFNKIDELLPNKKDLIIGIDGNCTAGKTTLANILKLRYNAQVIAMDHFFLQPFQRTEQRMNEIGGNLDYERFCEEVLPNLQSDENFKYKPFLCSTFDFGQEIIIDGTKIKVLEGSYSMHPKFGDIYDIKVFLQLENEEQLNRVKIRNGEKMLRVFKEKYIPMENAYFEFYDVKSKCDFIFNTSDI